MTAKAYITYPDLLAQLNRTDKKSESA